MTEFSKMLVTTGSLWIKKGKVLVVEAVGCGDGPELFVTYRMKTGGEGPFKMMISDFLEEMGPLFNRKGKHIQTEAQGPTIFDRLMEDDDAEE